MNLGEEHLILRNTVRKRMAEKDIGEMIKKYERHNAPFPWPFVKEKAKLGLTGINIPGEYGGSGADNLSGVIAMTEMSRVWPGGALILAVGNSLVGYPIACFGSKEQKKRWLPRLAAGKILGSFCLTESDHGSDAAHIRAYAKPLDGGGWLVTGEKHFITNSPVAKFFILFARTNRNIEGAGGVSAFLIPVKRKDVGQGRSIEISKPIHKMGLHAAHMATIKFTDHFIDKSCLLGGFGAPMSTLEHGRNWIGAQCVGLLDASEEFAAKQALNRKTFGEPIIVHSAVGDPIVEIAMAADISRMLLLYSAHLEDEGKEFAQYASLAKLFASEKVRVLSQKAQRIYGGSGYIMALPITRVVLDSLVPDIYEGTSEVQRSLIAKAWVKGKIPVYAPPFYEREFYALKERVKMALKPTGSALLLEDQREPFRAADMLPWWVAKDLIATEFNENWPKEFMWFKDPALLTALINEQIKTDMDGNVERNGNLWDEAKEHIIKEGPRF